MPKPKTTGQQTTIVQAGLDKPYYLYSLKVIWWVEINALFIWVNVCTQPKPKCKQNEWTTWNYTHGVFLCAFLKVKIVIIVNYSTYINWICVKVIWNNSWIQCICQSYFKATNLVLKLGFYTKFCLKTPDDWLNIRLSVTDDPDRVKGHIWENV